MIIWDLDDFKEYGDENCIDHLVEMKKAYPNLKVTLFTILGSWDSWTLTHLHKANSNWIELAAHGYYHRDNEEVLRWSKQHWYEILNMYENTGVNNSTFKKIFKAPNWQMSKLGYQVLKDLDWAVAVRMAQIQDVPKGAKYYSFEQQRGTHGHTWTLDAHKDEGMFEEWTRKSEFDFVSNNLKIK